MSLKIMKYRGTRFYLYKTLSTFKKAKEIADSQKKKNGCKYQIEKISEREFDLWLSKRISF